MTTIYAENIVYLYAFLAMFALDFVWAYYTKAITAHRVFSAASFASIIVLLNGVLAITVVGNKWAIIPAMLGAFSGTVIGLKLHWATGIEVTE